MRVNFLDRFINHYFRIDITHINKKYSSGEQNDYNRFLRLLFAGIPVAVVHA